MMNIDKQTEIHELVKQMSEAISTAVEQRYIEDEAKLQAVLVENGWRKDSDVAREIFEEIDAFFKRLDIEYGYFLRDMKKDYAELKKKYESENE